MKNEDIEQKIKQLTEYVNDFCPFVRKMERQLADNEIKHLLELYPLADIQSQLSKMDNWRGIEKKNRSVYQTVLRWFEMDVKRGYYTMQAHPAIDREQKQALKNEDFLQAEKERFLQKHPVGSEVEINGENWIVESKHFLRKKDNEKLMTLAIALSLQHIRGDIK